MSIKLKYACFLLLVSLISTSSSAQAGGRHPSFSFVAIPTPVVVLDRAPVLYYAANRYAHPTAYEYMHSPVLNPVLAMQPALHTVTLRPYFTTYSYPVHRTFHPVLSGW